MPGLIDARARLLEVPDKFWDDFPRILALDDNLGSALSGPSDVKDIDKLRALILALIEAKVVLPVCSSNCRSQSRPGSFDAWCQFLSPGGPVEGYTRTT